MVKKTRTKDFGSPALDNPDEVAKEPVYFTLYGEEFECHPDISGYALLDLVNKLTTSETSIQGILDFFDYVLIEDHRDKFKELAKSPDKKIKVELLSDIIEYVMEEYTDRDPKA